MPFLSATLRRASRALRATLLVGVLVLGAAAHAWHHVQDPDCGSGNDHSSHFCACSGLHGSTLAAEATATPAPRAVEWIEPACPERVAIAAAVGAAAAPRAPPEG